MKKYIIIVISFVFVSNISAASISDWDGINRVEFGANLGANAQLFYLTSII